MLGWPSRSLCPNETFSSSLCRVVTPYGAALGIQPWRLGKETPGEGRCPRGWGQAPCGYQQNKRARIALGASHSRGSSWCRPLFGFFLFGGGFFSPPLAIARQQWQLPADTGEGRLCLSASPAERARGCSWTEVPICHLPGFMHPQTRNQRRKAQTFCYLSPSSVQSAAAESNLVSAMPRFMVSQPHSRCWLPPGS